MMGMFVAPGTRVPILLDRTKAILDGGLGRFLKQRAEVGDGLFQTILEWNRGLPIESLLRQRDVGAALHGIVRRQWLERELRTASGQPQHFFRKLADRVLARISKIDRADEIRRR